MAEGVEDPNSFFTVRTVPFAEASWTYADARNVLLVVFGLTERTKQLVLIQQYRPPVAATVLSAPLGCFPDAAIEALLPLAAAEAETGHQVVRIAHLLDFARSPGLTTERARCFVAQYTELAGPRRLHADEQIEVFYRRGDPCGPRPHGPQPVGVPGGGCRAGTLVCDTAHCRCRSQGPTLSHPQSRRPSDVGAA